MLIDTSARCFFLIVSKVLTLLLNRRPVLLSMAVNFFSGLFSCLLNNSEDRYG